MGSSRMSTGDRLLQPKVVFFFILVVIVLIVLLQNSHAVSFHILFWEIRASLIVLLPLALVVGFVAGYISRMTTSSRDRRGATDDRS